jgi:hypothetical protein
VHHFLTFFDFENQAFHVALYFEDFSLAVGCSIEPAETLSSPDMFRDSSANFKPDGPQNQILTCPICSSFPPIAFNLSSVFIESPCTFIAGSMRAAVRRWTRRSD